jgi:hypothetical protein
VFGIPRDLVKLVIENYKHCQEQSNQKDKGAIKPIKSFCPGEQMVLDLMDFRVSHSPFFFFPAESPK